MVCEKSSRSSVCRSVCLPVCVSICASLSLSLSLSPPSPPLSLSLSLSLCISSHPVSCFFSSSFVYFSSNYYSPIGIQTFAAPQQANRCWVGSVRNETWSLPHTRHRTTKNRFPPSSEDAPSACLVMTAVLQNGWHLVSMFSCCYTKKSDLPFRFSLSEDFRSIQANGPGQKNKRQNRKQGILNYTKP